MNIHTPVATRLEIIILCSMFFTWGVTFAEADTSIYPLVIAILEPILIAVFAYPIFRRWNN